jgi:hypothetical protein
LTTWWPDAATASSFRHPWTAAAWIAAAAQKCSDFDRMIFISNVKDF